MIASCPGCVSGETVLAIAMTEPDAGSDLAGMRTTAVEHDDHWVVNGSEDLYLQWHQCRPGNPGGEDRSREQSPCHDPVPYRRARHGRVFERGRNLKKMGLKAQDTAELFFNDVKVPKENVLGEPGKGFYYLMEGLAEERLLGACGYLSAAQVF